MTDMTAGPHGGELRRLHPAGAPTRDQHSDRSDAAVSVPSLAPFKDSVIALREAGRSYAAIARQLTMSNSVQAQVAFIRAVRRRPEKERADLVERELARLDDLERKIRAGADADPAKSRQPLIALEKLRSALA